MRLLVVKIADGRSPEVAVLERLLANPPAGLEASVIYHGNGAAAADAEAFAEATRLPVKRIDFGWRPYCRQPGSRLKKTVSWLRFWTLGVPKAIAFAQARTPDAVLSSQQRWDCLAAYLLAIAGFRRRKQVIHLHYSPGPWLGRLALRRLRKSDLVICISDFIARSAVAVGCAPERVVTVYDPVESRPPASAEQRQAIRRRLGIPEDVIAIVMAARLDPNKRQIDAVEAFEGAELATAHLYFIGDGPDREKLERCIADHGLQNRVALLGFQPNASELLPAFDIFIHPSLDEPFGLAVAEASAAGLPVVAYRSGATPELIEHNVTGLLAGPGDVAELGSHLRALAADAGLSGEMGRNGASLVAGRFDPRVLGDKFAAAIGRLSARSAAPATEPQRPR